MFWWIITMLMFFGAFCLVVYCNKPRKLKSGPCIILFSIIFTQKQGRQHTKNTPRINTHCVFEAVFIHWIEMIYSLLWGTRYSPYTHLFLCLSCARPQAPAASPWWTCVCVPTNSCKTNKWFTTCGYIFTALQQFFLYRIFEVSDDVQIISPLRATEDIIQLAVSLKRTIWSMQICPVTPGSMPQQFCSGAACWKQLCSQVKTPPSVSALLTVLLHQKEEEEDEGREGGRRGRGYLFLHSPDLQESSNLRISMKYLKLLFYPQCVGQDAPRASMT